MLGTFVVCAADASVASFAAINGANAGGLSCDASATGAGAAVVVVEVVVESSTEGREGATVVGATVAMVGTTASTPASRRGGLCNTSAAQATPMSATQPPITRLRAGEAASERECRTGFSMSW